MSRGRETRRFFGHPSSFLWASGFYLSKRTRGVRDALRMMLSKGDIVTSWALIRTGQANGGHRHAASVFQNCTEAARQSSMSSRCREASSWEQKRVGARARATAGGNSSCQKSSAAQTSVHDALFTATETCKRKQKDGGAARRLCHTQLPQMRHTRKTYIQQHTSSPDAAWNSDLHTAARTTAREQGGSSLKRMSQEQHTTEQDTVGDRNEKEAQTTRSSQRHTLNACAAGSAILGTRWRTEASLGECGDKTSWWRRWRGWYPPLLRRCLQCFLRWRPSSARSSARLGVRATAAPRQKRQLRPRPRTGWRAGNHLRREPQQSRQPPKTNEEDEQHVRAAGRPRHHAPVEGDQAQTRGDPRCPHGTPPASLADHRPTTEETQNKHLATPAPAAGRHQDTGHGEPVRGKEAASRLPPAAEAP